MTQVERLAESAWNENGIDAVTFTVSTNPNSPQGPLNKIASGGELARFMLALKVNLADAGANLTMIFDEVDSGVGGATAQAVGERLARLASTVQVLIVTHSPQVAACGNHHFKVEKRPPVTLPPPMFMSWTGRRVLRRSRGCWRANMLPTKRERQRAFC